jgi:RNA polymerase sigma-70 factor (ECF subfamily)
MTRLATTRRPDDAAAATAIRAGDQAAFATLAERHRRELQVHCYRMLGSFEDAEDQVQETFLRAWRNRAGFEGRAPFRAWLYRIATNACLDALARSPRRAPEPPADGRPPMEVPWLGPYPDHLLEGVAPGEEEPEALIVARETVELAYLVAIQHLPPRTRAVLIMRDVLGWSAKDTAELLDTTVAGVNSALQRARGTLRRNLPERRLEWAPDTDPTEGERDLLRRYIEATERKDAGAFVAMMREDARFTMPPQPGVWAGAEAIVAMWIEGGIDTPEVGDMRCVVTRSNRQPAVACYRRRPGEDAFSPMAIDVLRIEEGLIADIVTFGPEVFASLGLPPTL